MIIKSTDDDTWQSVSKNILIADLTAQQSQSMREHSKSYFLESGQSLFRQDDAIHSFFILIKGQVKLSRSSPDGNEKIFDFIQAGQSFAEAVVLTGAPGYPVGCVALKESHAVGFDATHFRAMLEQNTQTCFNLIAQLSKRLHWHVNETDQLAQYNATYRLGGYLLHELELKQNDSQEIKLSVPKSMLASRLSIKPETFSRTLKRLSTLGLVEVHDTRIKVLDAQQLRTYLNKGEL